MLEKITNHCKVFHCFFKRRLESAELVFENRCQVRKYDTAFLK